MIAARGAALLVAALAAMVALGATDPHTQPSALRLMVTCVVGLLAPLFWPGAAATHGGTVLRVLAWSFAATALAALLLFALGSSRQPLPHVAEACVMLGLVLVVAHSATALLEFRWHAAQPDALARRELASRSVVFALAMFGALPLWLGPAAEALSSRHGWAVDATLAVSPAVHLAVASGNDLLRNQWWYEHSNIAALQFDYPGMPAIFGSYALALLALGLLAMALLHRRSKARDTYRTDQSMERTR